VVWNCKVSKGEVRGSGLFLAVSPPGRRRENIVSYMRKTMRYVVRVSREEGQDKRRLGSTWKKTETRKEESVRRMLEWNGGSSTGYGKAEHIEEQRKDREWGATWELPTRQIWSA